MNTAEFLAAARDEIRTCGWTQHHTRRPTGEVCIMGAFNNVLVNHGIEYRELLDDAFTCGAATRIMAETIRAEADTPEILGVIPWFNDQPTTTLEDVELVFKKAIVAAEEADA